MTEEPRRYENYPPTAEADPGAPAEQQPAPSGWVATPPAPSPVPPQSGPSRRLLFAGAMGVVALAAPIVWGLARDPEPGDPDPYESFAGGPGVPDPPDQDDETSYDLDGLEVRVPDGWDEVSNTDHRLVIARGGSTVTFLHYAAGQDASAADEAAEQVRRYAASVRKATKPSTTSDTDGDIESAETVLSGQVDGTPVDVRSSVRIDTSTDDYAAAAVVSVIFQNPAKGVRADVATMRRDFLDQLG